MTGTVHDWDIRTGGGATGIEVARARLSSEHTLVLAHALPTEVDVRVWENGARLVATGEHLRDETPTPMCRLWIDGVRILRRNVWPGEDDLGRPVILPGGEAGILRAWEHDDKRTRWRWSVEFLGTA
ncbi:MAG TPA: hypothetical protein VF235_04805 [Actinomycetota bacterium]